MSNLTQTKRRELKDRAMPEVKRLVTVHGYSIINGCLLLLKDNAKKQKKLAALKREAEQLEKELKQ